MAFFETFWLLTLRKIDRRAGGCVSSKFQDKRSSESDDAAQVVPVQIPSIVTPQARAPGVDASLVLWGRVRRHWHQSPTPLRRPFGRPTAGGQLTENMVIGVMSFMLWTLTIIVTLNKLWLIMSAE